VHTGLDIKLFKALAQRASGCYVLLAQNGKCRPIKKMFSFKFVEL
jgi:hypothetical protein